MMIRSLALACAALIALGGCRQEQRSDPADAVPSAGAATAQARHAVSGLPVIPLRVQTGRAVHDFVVEVAASREEQAKGLMFRTQLGPDEGMIFPMDPPRPAAFWMRNTVIPLDMLFIGPDHAILNISANATPYDESPRASAGEVMAVLELPGGRAQELGIMAGDRVDW